MRACLQAGLLLFGFLSAFAAIAQVPRVAILIDDLGYQLASGKRLLDRPEPISVAVLPNAPHAKPLAETANLNNKALLLHLPMQANGSVPLEKYWLALNSDRAQMSDLLRRALAAVPGAVGVNNHQGSAFTASKTAMSKLMLALRSRNLFFVDSRTTAETVARKTACEYQVPFAERRVFLDNDKSPEALAKAFARLESEAARNGFAIGIGHPHKATLAALYQWLDSLPSKSLKLVPVTELLTQPSKEPSAWPAC